MLTRDSLFRCTLRQVLLYLTYFGTFTLLKHYWKGEKQCKSLRNWWHQWMACEQIDPVLPNLPQFCCIHTSHVSRVRNLYWMWTMSFSTLTSKCTPDVMMYVCTITFEWIDSVIPNISLCVRNPCWVSITRIDIDFQAHLEL